ncbi:MAG: UDP-N-acetylmuramate--L-alanine ligase [Bacteroidota bacterium]
MRIHFIAIGGSAMHNLAIALHKKGYHVTGSDDEVFEPSRSRLKKYGLLPAQMGWSPDRITNDIDVIILGMHARPENPELKRARELGLRVYSYPEYLYEQTRDKKRVVIAGSHGKTTITSMLLHALRELGFRFDFMVGASIKGFDTMVSLSNDTDLAIFEGDEYLSSPVDRRPKFVWYHPHIALITGVAWDHVNVFPTESEYNEQFRLFADTIEDGGTLIYYEGDPLVRKIAGSLSRVECIPYRTVDSVARDDQTVVKNGSQELLLKIFGPHNLQNLAGAMEVARKLGVSAGDFLEAMRTFEGADRRLQVLGENSNAKIFFDFAHAPSKVRASVAAVKAQYPSRKLVAAVELHTFSSLSREFLPQYRYAMEDADEAIVFFSPEVVAHKKLPAITADEVADAFDHPDMEVFDDPRTFKQRLQSLHLKNTNLLLMTSGNFAGIDVQGLAEKLL